jgi:hypothetical protein
MATPVQNPKGSTPRTACHMGALLCAINSLLVVSLFEPPYLLQIKGSWIVNLRWILIEAFEDPFFFSPHPFNFSPRPMNPFNFSPHPFNFSPHPFNFSPHPFNFSPHPFLFSPHLFSFSLHPFGAIIAPAKKNMRGSFMWKAFWSYDSRHVSFQQIPRLASDPVTNRLARRGLPPFSSRAPTPPPPHPHPTRLGQMAP